MKADLARVTGERDRLKTAVDGVVEAWKHLDSAIPLRCECEEWDIRSQQLRSATDRIGKAISTAIDAAQEVLSHRRCECKKSCTREEQFDCEYEIHPDRPSEEKE
jgi:hypothetical protein